MVLRCGFSAALLPLTSRGAGGVPGSARRGRESKKEGGEINKTEENRSINISAAAPFTDLS